MKIIKLFFIIFYISKIISLEEPISNISIKSSNISENYTSYFLNSTIRTLNDNDFDIRVHANTSKPYLILFTIRRCGICNKIITTMENVQKYISAKNNLEFAKIDCYSSSWTALRFEISQLPLFIYIENDKYSTYAPNNVTEENLIKFIESKDKKFVKYPKKIGYIGVAMKILNLVADSIQKKFDFSSQGFSWAIILSIILIFIYIQYLIYKCCFAKKRTNNKESESKYKIKEKKIKKKKNE
jgi:hypothetical protein